MSKIRFVSLSKPSINVLNEVKRIFITESEVPGIYRIVESMGMPRNTVLYHYRRFVETKILIKVGRGQYRFSRRPYAIEVSN